MKKTTNNKKVKAKLGKRRFQIIKKMEEMKAFVTQEFSEDDYEKLIYEDGYYE